ncbi:CotH kinase family protein [Dactylosporangium sp. NPDC050688]|uniref:CotH kinase family protein n=1 Tax=Dactylosporangium sp. NPDC050688 TaxID=3157217 RepID=UPI0033DD7EB2
MSHTRRRGPRARRYTAGWLAAILTAVACLVAGPPPAAADLTGDITFSVPSGTFQGELAVTLGTSVAGAQIRYTTDGRVPDAASTLYAGAPVRFSRTTQLRAQAFVAGQPSGAPGTALYVARAVTATHDLPIVVLDAYGAGKPGRDYVDVAVMEFQPAGGTASLTATPALTSRAGFHLHGQSTATLPKTPYRLELRDNAGDDVDLPLLGMPADSDWVMRGPYTDKTLIHDAFMFSLARDMGRAAPRFAFAEVYVNLDAQPVSADDYQGVYLFIETIKNSKNRLDLKQLDPEDVTLPKIQGGYIFKFEWLAAEEPTLPCTGQSCWSFLEVVDPDPLQPAQKTWLTQHIQQFNDVLHSGQFADPVTGYPAYIDVGSFVDQLILNELSREMDAYLRSAYFHKDRTGKITAGPVWDYDLTFGVGGYFNNQQTSGWQYQQTRQPVANDWFNRLMLDPAFVNQVKTRWQQLRGGVLSTAQLNARIAGLTGPLAAAAARNFQKWPTLTSAQIGPFITPTAATWQGHVDLMRTWLTQRIAWLESPGGGGWLSSTSPSPSPSSSPSSGGSGGCTAAYTVTNQWQGGFQGDVKVTAGPAAIRGWTVTWTFPNGQTVGQAWGATVTAAGGAVTARNVSYNGTLGAGAATSFGFLGTWTTANDRPATVTCAPA